MADARREGFHDPIYCPRGRNHFLRAFNLGVSAWMSAASKLPVDYQVQPITKANELYPSPENPRNGLGLL